MRIFTYKIISISVPLVIFFFLGRVIVSQWHLLDNYSWDFDVSYLISSFILLLLTFVLWALLFQKLFFQLNGKLSLKKTFKVLYLSNLGRYIPGKVWQFVGMYYLLEKENIGRLKATSGIVWSNVFTNLSAVLIGISLVTLSRFELSRVHIVLLVVIFSATFIAIQPQVIDGTINYILKKLKKDQIKISLPFFSIVSFIIFYAGVWVCTGTAFFLLIKSLTDVDISLLPVFIGFFASSYVIGYLAIIAPGGLGVREAVLTYMLSYYLPLPVATLIAVMARLWLTLGELVCVAVAVKIK